MGDHAEDHAKTHAKTPKRKTPGTKFWNVNLNQLPADESLAFDYEDQDKSRFCGVKLRSKQLDKWITAHKDAFNETFERTKETTVTWKSTPGITCMTVQTTTATRKSGKGLLSVHFYHKKHGLMVQGQCTKWWMNILYPELLVNINAQVDMQTRSTIKDGVLRVRDAIDNFPTVTLESTTPKQVFNSSVHETPTLPKCANPRNLQDLQAPVSEVMEEEIQIVFDTSAKHSGNIEVPVSRDAEDQGPGRIEKRAKQVSDTKNGEQSELTTKAVDMPNLARLTAVEKSQRISDAAFGDLQKQFVDMTHNLNALRDELLTKEREREESQTNMLKELSTKVEAAQKSLESHIKKVVNKLQTNICHVQKDLVSQREELAKEKNATVQEMTIERNIWMERNRGLSIKVDALSASNAELQQAITIQDSELQYLFDRLKQIEENRTCRGCTKPTHTDMQNLNNVHDNDIPGDKQDNNAATNQTIVKQIANMLPSAHDNATIATQSREVPSPATSVKESATNTSTGSQHQRYEVRIFADSIFRDVDVKRAFNGKSTRLVRTSTVTAAIDCIKQINDSTTQQVILHIGSNDLDNSKQRNDSVSTTLNNTRRLLEVTKASFPKAQVAVSQVLQRGLNDNSTLNINIKNYNQEVLNLSRSGNFKYIKHRKLTQDRHLYLPDQIHLDPRSGTKMLVSDVKRTLYPAPGPGAGRQSPAWTDTQAARLPVNQWTPMQNGPSFSRSVPVPVMRSRKPPYQPPTVKPAHRNTSVGTGQAAPGLSKGVNIGVPGQLGPTTKSRNTVSGNGQVARPAWLKAGKFGHPGPQWKQLGNRLRKVWNILIS